MYMLYFWCSVLSVRLTVGIACHSGYVVDHLADTSNDTFIGMKKNVYKAWNMHNDDEIQDPGVTLGQ